MRGNQEAGSQGPASCCVCGPSRSPIKSGTGVFEARAGVIGVGGTFETVSVGTHFSFARILAVLDADRERDAPIRRKTVLVLSFAVVAEVGNRLGQVHSMERSQIGVRLVGLTGLVAAALLFASFVWNGGGGG